MDNAFHFTCSMLSESAHLRVHTRIQRALERAHPSYIVLLLRPSITSIKLRLIVIVVTAFVLEYMDWKVCGMQYAYNHDQVREQYLFT